MKACTKANFVLYDVLCDSYIGGGRYAWISTIDLQKAYAIWPLWAVISYSRPSRFAWPLVKGVWSCNMGDYALWGVCGSGTAIDLK